MKYLLNQFSTIKIFHLSRPTPQYFVYCEYNVGIYLSRRLFLLLKQIFENILF